MQAVEKRLSRMNTIFKALGWYQIIGGIIGFGMLAWASTMANGWNNSLLLLLLFIALLYGFSIYCGAVLLKNPVKGLSRSFVNQLLQTVQFGLMGYVFKFISGIAISVKWMPVMSVHFGLEASSFVIQFNSDEMHAFIGVNLVAVFLAYYTIHIKDAYTEALLAKEITDIADIGHN
jgi:hypothetical protein